MYFLKFSYQTDVADIRYVLTFSLAGGGDNGMTDKTTAKQQTTRLFQLSSLLIFSIQNTLLLYKVSVKVSSKFVGPNCTESEWGQRGEGLFSTFGED